MLESFSQRSFHASFTSLTLLEKAKGHDEKAWEIVVRLYAPLVYRWCRRAGMAYHDIENLSQEVFTLAFRKLDQFEKASPHDSFRGWLYTLVRNRRIDWLRKKAKQADAFGGDQPLTMQQQIPDPLSLEVIEDRDEREREELYLYNRAIQLIRSEFSDRDQEIIESLMCRSEDPNLLAKRLGVSRNTVYIVKSRAIRRLREEFAGLITQETDFEESSSRVPK